MGNLIGNTQPDPDVVEIMKSSPHNFSDTRWAAYQNHDLGHRDIGHLQFLAVGPQNTVKEAPKPRLPDYPDRINWRYQFVGFVNLETGLIEEE